MHIEMHIGHGQNAFKKKKSKLNEVVGKIWVDENWN